MKYMAIIDADKKPISCEFTGLIAPYRAGCIGATTDIKELEQEPCEDCISREAVLSLPRLITDLDISTKTLTESVDIKMIESLPSVTPKPKTGHWILVSERLPDVGDEYLITVRERWGKDEEWEYETLGAYYTQDSWEPSYDIDEGQEWEVIAWMSLPEPYRAESEDKE